VGGTPANFSFVINEELGATFNVAVLELRRLPPPASLSTLHCYAPIYGLVRLIPLPNRHPMTGDDDSFRIRPGRVRDRGAGVGQVVRPRPVRHRPTSFIAQVHQAIRRAGGNPNRFAGTGKASGRCNALGRGAKVAAGLKGRNGWNCDASGVRTRARRVAVKARIVKLNPQRGAARGRQFVSGKAVDAHLRYLERDGVTRDGEKVQVYSADKDVADGAAFLDRGRDDRHQFRFIVSAEEGVELSDLRQTTRDLMTQMEADLGTRLDWIAVDHHNTGHPHTHILLRGVTDDGKRLDIAGDYIAHGIRERASEIVTLELGRQTEQEVSRQLEREVDAERFTRLDRMLIAEQDASNEFADLRPDKDMAETMRQNRALMIDRARKLERMGLATEHTPGVWTISPRAEPMLRDLGTRGDIIKTMHQALDREGLAEQRAYAGYTVHRAAPTERIVGRVVAKGLGSDELGERMGLTIDGVDGRVHHLEVPAAKVEDIRRGSIVAVDPPPSTTRVADENILQQTDTNGIYRPSAHMESVRETMPRIDHERHVQSHVRRLEALRRAGIVERLDADRWSVPADLPERGLAHDRQRFGKGPRIEELSHLPLNQQVRHEGATWLDRTMLEGGRDTMPHTGFGGDVRTAWEARKRALTDMGYARDVGGGQFRAPSDLIAQLEQVEVNRAGRKFAAERGLDWQPTGIGDRVSGKLVGQAQLSSGRFAMIDNGLGFQLVPWNDALDKRLGQQISGIAMSGGGVDWTLGRKLGLGL
jgi:type IV secretory pathway VirD2 relaxase